MFESGAILIYLGEKTGKLIPKDARKRVAMFEWLMWQMGGFGPMLGQAHHFLGMKEPDEYGVQRYLKETQRLYGVLDRRLAKNEYVAGDEYTIADIAILGWAHRHPRHKVDLDRLPERQALVRDAVGASGGEERYADAGRPEHVTGAASRADGKGAAWPPFHCADGPAGRGSPSPNAVAGLD